MYVRHGGDRGPVVVLLHGLVATGDTFGADFDTLAARSTLVVPDLLGFGRSLDESRSSFTTEDHLDALDAVLTSLDLDHRPLVIGAFALVALAQVGAVVAIGIGLLGLDITGPLWLALTLAVAAGALALGALTLRRRTP